MLEASLLRQASSADVVVLVRYGELAVKGAPTRRRMQARLARNLQEALERKHVEHSGVRVVEGRVLVEGPTPLERAVETASRVFGVVSVSPSVRFAASTLEEIVRGAIELLEEAFVNKRVRVVARRVGAHDFTSLDVAKRLGSLMLERGASGVDLKNPEYTVYLEIRGNTIYLYDVVVPGPGGIPLGSEGRVLALVSGGFDSAVASWMLMKRGSRVDLAFFNIGGEEQARVAREVACYLACEWAHGVEPVLHEVELRWLMPLLAMHFPEGYRHVVLKRAMYAGAEALARRYGARALATGESLAQVSSQTLHNLVVTEEYIDMPVLRPLIGMDKEEIIQLARKIGTYDISVKTREFCALATPRPSTSVDRERVNRLMQEHLPKQQIVEYTLKYHKRIKLKQECQC